MARDRSDGRVAPPKGTEPCFSEGALVDVERFRSSKSDGTTVLARAQTLRNRSHSSRVEAAELTCDDGRAKSV